MSTTILTVANQKGGVGKTTTVANLAHGLALQGKQVLVIDLDPQGQVATTFGVSRDRGVYHLLTRIGDTAAEIASVRQWIIESGRPNLWLLPGNEMTTGAQIHMDVMKKDIGHIRWSIKPFTREDLNFVIFDTSPSLGGLQERALWAADLVVVPAPPEYLALDGLKRTINLLGALKSEKAWKGGLLGVLPTFYEEQTLASQAAIIDLQNGFAQKGLLLPTVHRATVLRECGASGQTIFERDPDSRAASEYRQLVAKVIEYSR